MIRDFGNWLTWEPLAFLAVIGGYTAMVALAYNHWVKRPERLRLADRLRIAQTDFKSAQEALDDEGKFVSSARRRTATATNADLTQTTGTAVPPATGTGAAVPPATGSDPTLRQIAHLEEQTLSLLPAELVRAKGFVVLGLLLPAGPDKVLGAQLKAALSADIVTKSSNTPGVTATYLRQLVIEGTRLLNLRDEANAEERDRWTHRALFLTGSLLLGVTMLAASIDIWAILLIGGLGGILGRAVPSIPLRRPVSEGRHSWGAQFLAGPIGALAAFAGLLLISLLIEIQILDADTFSAFVDPLTPGLPPLSVLAVAFALGFVERLLTSLTQRATSAFDAPPTPTQQSTIEVDPLVAGTLVAAGEEEE